MRGCIFCGERATTREHVFASWLMQAVTGKSMAAHIVITIGTERKAPWVERGEGLGVKLKHLCGRCNNGWMSQLETRAKPYLLPMLRDVALPLNQDVQSVVSSWIMKTVMVCEFLAPEKAWYSGEERHTFRDTLRPPMGTAIWLGRCSRTGWSSTITRKIQFGLGWPFTEGTVATFAIDHLVFQLLTVKPQAGEHDRGKVTYKSTNVPDPWAKRMFQCWPLQPGAPEWPPLQAAAMDENDVQQLARRFEAAPHC